MAAKRVTETRLFGKPYVWVRVDGKWTLVSPAGLHDAVGKLADELAQPKATK